MKYPVNPPPPLIVSLGIKSNIMIEEFSESEYKETLISIAKGDLDIAIEKLINNKSISNKELKEVSLRLLQKQEIESLDWFSNRDNEDTKLESIVEMCRLTYALELGNFKNSIRESVEKIAYKLICDYGLEIEQESGEYPDEPISGLVWMDGAAVREWAYFMAEYFNRKQDKEHELQMLFIRAKVTNSIMSHYYHLVGPAMVDLGFCCIKNNLPEKAENFFNAVILDFDWLLEEYADSKPDDEDLVAIGSLKNAFEGMLKIKNDNTYESKIENINNILQLKDA